MSGNLKVLCVDDNRDVAASTAHLLEMAGCEVRVCHDSRSALIVAKEFCPDVCVLDLVMPGITGDQLAIQLRQEAGDRPLRCIALTGRWDVEAQHQTHNATFEEHLVKPVAPERLVEVVTGRRLAGVS